MEDGPEVNKWLSPPGPTPEDERCVCVGEPPIKLMSMRHIDLFNPIHCVDCNLEVAPEKLELTLELAEEIAYWDWRYGPLRTLESASGAYESWARLRLLDPASPSNVEGRELAGRLSRLRRCYFWPFQPHSDEEWVAPTACPVCKGPLERYDGGILPQLLCERDHLVFAGA